MKTDWVKRDSKPWKVPQVELIPPAELEPGPGEGVVADLGTRMALGQISRVGRDLVGDHALTDVVLVG
jgi:hypothetical protein